MDAFAPGSVTGIFVPPEGEMTEGAGGVSFAINDGVTVSVEAAATSSVTVNGEPASFEPVERVLARLDVTAAVDVMPSVPLGNGFGASGAATLATAIAGNATFTLDRDRATLVDHAHRAEVAAGTGLGDVFIQDAGGLLWSDGDGRHRVAVDASVEYSSFGGIATSDALGDEDSMARVRDVGSAVLARLPVPPDLRTVIELSWEFTQGTGIAPDRVVREVERVRAAGGLATMAMLGETVIAIDADDMLEHRTRVNNAGAVLQKS